MNKLILSIILLLCLHLAQAQTQSDTLFNYKTDVPVTIDGQALEACWESATWNPINQVWMPFGANVPAEDFTGQFKVSWDEAYLYYLVEVVDDSLSDDYANPLQNWWDDDCLEIFIDEDRSKGDHECNNNAFAYHLSLFYDAIDLSGNTSCNGINYKEHVQVVMDTIGENTYLWEMAIKIYDDSFEIGSEAESRVTLEPNKHMGIAIAYCDSDEDKNRENFIGSMVMTQATHNDMYKNADHFGLMILVDPNGPGVGIEAKEEIQLKLYPNPASEIITIKVNTALRGQYFEVYSSVGKLISKQNFNGEEVSLNINDMEQGIYFVQVHSGELTISQSFLKR